ncbi:hypothetical protein Tco_0381076 [Tanacetum coccineum]
MEYDSSVNERMTQTTEEKVASYDAHVADAYIRPIYDEDPMAEVQTTTEINIFATGQQHTEQPEFNNEGECMRTRNSYFPNNSNVTIPRRRNRGRAPNIVEPELRTIVAPMAERTMEELLWAPTKGYEEAIVLPESMRITLRLRTIASIGSSTPYYGR